MDKRGINPNGMIIVPKIEREKYVPPVQTVLDQSKQIISDYQLAIRKNLSYQTILKKMMYTDPFWSAMIHV